VSVAGRVAAIGAEVAVQGFGLAGALVLPADGPEQARAAFRSLPSDVTVLILTRDAWAALPEVAGATLPLTVVLP
jgi:vacuolar-type H+-ATPase subunit F/Vma7